MSRRRTRIALTTAVVLAAAASPAAADIDDFAEQPPADPAAMVASVQQQMAGRAFGWQLAIAQDGKLVKTAKDGWARSAADNGGKALAMLPTMRMELASATKTVTAVATMKLLRANGLTVESSIDPYLPSNWTRGPGFKSKVVRFRHLLNHTSGLDQAMNAMPVATRPKNNSWDDMQVVVANGTTVPSQRNYKNANYALLRIINAELWRRSGGQKTVTEIVEIYNTKGIEIGTKEVVVKIPVTEDNHTSYTLDYLRKRIFEPAGVKNVGCVATDPTTAIASYPINATQQTKGAVQGTSMAECAGARGLRLSAVDHVRFLANLRHGTIIHPDDLDAMDEQTFGWNEDSGGGDGGEFGTADGEPDQAWSIGAYWHGGDLIGTNQLHTCGATYEDGTEVSLLVNSQLTASDPCSIVNAAWRAAG